MIPRRYIKGFDLHPDVSMAERHTFNLKEHEVETVGKKERFRRNIMAIQLLKKCQEENRFATLEEQIILSKYVGWGGLSEAFDENNSAWATEYLELSSVLRYPTGCAASGKAVSSREIKLFFSMVCTLEYCWYWR